MFHIDHIRIENLTRNGHYANIFIIIFTATLTSYGLMNSNIIKNENIDSPASVRTGNNAPNIHTSQFNSIL